MLFDGIAPKAKNVDPEFLRFDSALRMQYIYAHAIAQLAEMTKAFANFGITMKKAGEAFAKVAKFLKEHPEWQNLNSKLKTGSNAMN